MLFKKYKYIFLFAFLSCSVLACKKVVQLKLNNATPQIVITGEVNNLQGPYTVTIANSVNFSANNSFPGISNAFVTLNGNGILDTLTPTSAGNYVSHNILGVFNSSYTLNVLYNGVNYNATSIMPPIVNLDSVGVLGDIAQQNQYFPVAYFKDPAGVVNYYAFNVYKNGKALPSGRGNFAFSDRLSDGRNISISLRSDSADFKKGDTATVQMKCIDANVYKYLAQLSNGFGPPNASQTPANPTSNINNNALGYFSANTSQSKTVIIH